MRARRTCRPRRASRSGTSRISAPDLLEALDDIRRPDVLADRQAEAHAAEIDRPRHRPGGEDALLVEHAVVGQVVLIALGGDGSAVEQQDRVVELAPVPPRRRDQHRRLAGDGFRRQLFHRRFNPVLKKRLQNQIFGRVSRHHQLGKDDQIDTRTGVPGPRGCGRYCPPRRRRRDCTGPGQWLTGRS